MIYYPAIFHRAEEGGFWVDFPDIPGCFTQGETMDETYRMATEAMGLRLVDYVIRDEQMPEATALDRVSVNDGDVVVLIGFDYLDYKRKNSKKAVKKTLSIPEWLNELALKENINFSQVLQDALIERLVK